MYFIKKPWFKFGSIFLSTYPYRINNFLKTNSFDIINAHTLDFASVHKQYKKKLIFTPHGFNWIEQKYIHPLKKPFWNLFYVRRFFSILRHVQYLISINPCSTEEFEQFTNATIFDIPNPVSDSFFDISQKPSVNSFLWMGVISKMKNLYTLLKALVIIKEKKKDFTLYVAGKIDDIEYYRQLTLFIAQKGLQDHVVFLGVINNHRKIEYFSKMSFFILTSFNEHAPMVISESFAASRPVIASNVGGIPYMIEENKTGFLVDPNNEQQIADKILFLLENTSIAEKMGFNARQVALKQNVLSLVIERYRRAYSYVYENL